MIRVYTASKLYHSEMWRTALPLNAWLQSRWLQHTIIATPDQPSHAPEFWLQNEEDIRHSDCVLVYAYCDDRLRGALVEAGMALAYGVPVAVIGQHPDYGTWQYHPGVTRVPDFAALPAFFDSLTPGYRTMKRLRQNGSD